MELKFKHRKVEFLVKLLRSAYGFSIEEGFRGRIWVVLGHFGSILVLTGLVFYYDWRGRGSILVDGVPKLW